MFPLVPEQKTPLTPRGFHDASADSEQIERWWAAQPAAGIGLPTGNGLAVIDVDLQHGGELDPNWPGTLTARTRSGGWHLYYRVEREVPNSAGRLGRGIDVRGDGGYVVAPPTPGWRWANPGYAIAEIDTMFLVPARGPGSVLAEGHEFFEMAEAAGDVGEGGRNDYLARFTGWLIRLGLTEDAELEDAVERENDRACDPPLGLDEVHAIVRSVGRYR